ncbi:STAS domain-containing protein [Paenibacillus sp. NPDC056579]|uniref:STAS domain-containing protein n=1 Tax=Paenibacillus sp. NPDC056579 TaxID=3345871 RepID=UPI0036D2019A
MKGPAYNPKGKDREQLHISETSLGAYQHFMLSGKLTYGNDGKAKEWLGRLVKPCEGYILDLTELTLIDSTGLGVLIYFKKSFDKGEGRLVVILRDELMKELAAIAKLHLVVSLCSDLEEAVRLLDSKRQEE